MSDRRIVERLREWPLSEKLALEAADRIEALEAAQEEALGYATRLLEHFVAEHFPHNPDWKPLPNLIGVLTQLDNASTIVRDYKARIEALEAALRKITEMPGTFIDARPIARAALAPEQDK